MFKDNLNLSNNLQDNLYILKNKQKQSNMDYLTNFYKNRCDQLQEQVNRLSYRVRLLSEEGDSEAGEAQERPDANPWATPEWSPPEFNPSLPQSPVRPPNDTEWTRDNPRPNPNNYDGRENDPEYKRDLDLWHAAQIRAHDNYMRWYRYMRGLNRITGEGKDKEWRLPHYFPSDFD